MRRDDHQHLLDVLGEVSQERQRQDDRFGEQNRPPIEWLAILAEEFGEVSREVVDGHFGDEGIRDNYRTELIQLAAVAVAAAQCLDRSQRPVEWSVYFPRINARAVSPEGEARASVKSWRRLGTECYLERRTLGPWTKVAV